jgi:hypothetical protein
MKIIRDLKQKQTKNDGNNRKIGAQTTGEKYGWI